jgi:glycosyltransferase involved in cell wall biosynthesis
VVNKPNGGLASARNAGVAIAAGEYVWHVDSDDYANVEALGKMVETACKDNSDIVISGYKRIPDDQKNNKSFYVSPHFNKILSGTDALCLMLCTNIGGDVWSKLYKRSLYTENRITQKEEFSACEDVLLNYQLFSKAQIISPLEYASIHHFYHPGSLSSQAKRKAENFIVSHHLGFLYITNYGFLTENIKNACLGLIGSDFLRCYKCMNKTILDKIGVKSVKEINYYLNCLSCYNKVKLEGVKLSFKRKYIFGMFGITPVRYFTAYFMKGFSVFFKKQ